MRPAFEVEDRQVFHEDYGQPTSIDLVVDFEPPSAPIFIEAKLVEKKFGGCSVFAAGDCDGLNPVKDFTLCYLHHVGRKYWDRMKEHGFLAGALAASPICPFASYYQFFREALFALHKCGYFVLLYDARNPTFFADGPQGRRGLWPFLLSLIPEVPRSRMRAISVQQLFQEIVNAGGHEDWTPEFSKKYAIQPEVTGTP